MPAFYKGRELVLIQWRTKRKKELTTGAGWREPVALRNDRQYKRRRTVDQTQETRDFNVKNPFKVEGKKPWAPTSKSSLYQVRLQTSEIYNLGYPNLGAFPYTSLWCILSWGRWSVYIGRKNPTPSSISNTELIDGVVSLNANGPLRFGPSLNLDHSSTPWFTNNGTLDNVEDLFS